MRFFTKAEQEILDQVATEVDDFLDDQRKGVAQSKYVLHVSDRATWDDWGNDTTDISVPTELHGHWMMAYAEDTDELSFSDSIKKMHWVKCHKIPVTTHEWVEVPDFG